MLPPEILEEVQRMAAGSPRREICGFISKQMRIFPIRNVSPTPDSFLMYKRDHAQALNEMKATGDTVKAVYHSHPVNPLASDKDLQYFKKSGADMLIVTPPAQWSYYVNDSH